MVTSDQTRLHYYIITVVGLLLHDVPAAAQQQRAVEW